MSLLRSLRIGVASLALFQFAIGNSVAGPPPQGGTEDGNTVTPIKHVIVIVGENRSFDHLFATCVPKAGEKVKNLFSEGIVNADGTRGPNFSRAIQYSADITGATSFQLSPTSKTPYAVLPVPLTGGPSNVYKDNGMCKLTDAKSSENGLPRSPVTYYQSLLMGGSGLSGKVPDSRIRVVSSSAPYSTLQPGPFQVTNTTAFPYTSYANSPVHRFYQMWQQEDCSAQNPKKEFGLGVTQAARAFRRRLVGSPSKFLMSLIT